MPSKIYSPLRANQTRFLTIKPSLFSFRNIHCTLETVDVEGDEISKKEALSYTWGDEVASHGIVVNRRTFKVRANLYQALRHLRDKSHDRTIWIDAICINQGDLIERGAQVLLMSKIFSSVRQVIVWLGVENEGGDPGLRLLSKSMKYLSDEQIREYSGNIFERPWWHRSWVIQEFVKAKERVFVCGDIVLKSGAMTDMWLAFKEWSGNWLVWRHMGDSERHILLFDRLSKARVGETLRQWMLLCGHCLATDPRDKIYAFFDLAKDAEGLRFVPDYTKSVQMVYEDFVKAYFDKEGNLEIICTHYRQGELVDLPSWVPDWRIALPTWQNWMVQRGQHSLYGAGYPYGWDPQDVMLDASEYTSFGEDHSLNVTGVQVGSISKAKTALTPETFSSEEWIRAIAAWKTDDVASGWYLDGESNHKAFCHTVTADSNTFWRSYRERESRLSMEDVDREAFATGSMDYNTAAALRQAAYHSRFAVLSSDHFAMVPNRADLEDLVYVLRGFSTPMALRRNEANAATATEDLFKVTYRMIGPCYVHGVMDGEMVEMATERITIV